MSVPFVANHGQADNRVAYYARTLAATVFVTRDGKVVYSLAGRGGKPSNGNASGTGWALSETFSDRSLEPSGSEPAPVRISSFVGHDSQHVTDVATFARVDLGQTSPGISVELHATDNSVEKFFHLAAGRSVDRIRVRVGGANRMSIAQNGNLVLETGIGDVEFSAPIAFQESGGRRLPVRAAYTVSADTMEYGFQVGEYDRALPLTIDPLIRSTYVGGTSSDVVRAMVVHPGSSEVFVAGFTASIDFPIAAGPSTTNSGGTDAFVAIYNAGLTSLARATYYGGDGDDRAYAITIMPNSGEIYIAGTTTSSTLPEGGTRKGASDAFIARFNGALTLLTGGGLFGGDGDENGSALAVDNIANVVILAGDTTSTNLPLAGSPQQGTNGGAKDAFVARFPSILGAPTQATYLGGSSDDQALAVALDPISSDTFVAGMTQSSNLPGTANGALSTSAGLNEGFVTRFNSNLFLQQSTYFGGSGNDAVNAIAVHPINGQIYITGDTGSQLRGKLTGQVLPGSGSDAFVARLNPDLTGVLSVSYFGGTGDDFGHALALNRFTGEAYIAGYTNSPSLGGTGAAMQPAKAGVLNDASNDAFAARFDAALAGIRQATFLGGSGSDQAHAIAVTDAVVYLAGETGSTAFPGTSAQSAQPAPSGPGDGFIAQMTSDLRQDSSSPAAFAFAPRSGVLPLSIQTSEPVQILPVAGFAATGYVEGQPGSTWCASPTATCSSCEFTGGTFKLGAQTLPLGPTPYYVCVRHTASAAPDVITETTLHVGTQVGTFRVATGSVPGFGCTLDADGNGVQEALTDGMLILRGLFGMTGTAATNGVIGENPLRSSWSEISAYLNSKCGGNFQ